MLHRSTNTENCVGAVPGQVSAPAALGIGLSRSPRDDGSSSAIRGLVAVSFCSSVTQRLMHSGCDAEALPHAQSQRPRGCWTTEVSDGTSASLW